MSLKTPRILGLGWLVFLVLGLAACDGRTALTQSRQAVAPASTFFPIKIGPADARLQLALGLAEMQHGLMGRADLGENDGMIFLYTEPQKMSFWMRNTPTPLDIGFFDADGILREIYPLYPYNEVPVTSAGNDLKYAVEMPRGWYEAKGVEAGARLDGKALAEAIRRRGENPSRWQLN